MRRLNSGTVLALSFVLGCGSPAGPPDYGPPSSSTTIDLQRGDRGLDRPPHVRLEGTEATYSVNLQTGQATIATADVAAIIHALEDVEFLDVGDDGDDDTLCDHHDNAWSYTVIEASLSAGSNVVDRNHGCSGGIFDRLARLEELVLDRSGFNAWFAAR